MRRLVALAALVVVAGCGGDGGDDTAATVTPAKHRAPTAAESRAIRATIASLERAIRKGDANAVCNLYGEDARESSAQVYASCDTSVRSDLEGKKPPRLEVGKIDVNWDPAERPRSLQASVAVTSSARGRDPIDVDAGLILEGGSWHLLDFADAFVSKPDSGAGGGGGGAEEPDE
ncbi:MAG TPA: hypothetical protein VJT75_08820 [Thermoleophilaceae bacterium]|nr:hypothetical protein [Thermoleophilaceae bacterium]